MRDAILFMKLEEELRSEIKKLRHRVWQLEAELLEVREQLRQEKTKNQNIETQLKKSSDNAVPLGIETATQEEVLFEQPFDVNGPFYNFGDPDGEDSTHVIQILLTIDQETS